MLSVSDSVADFGCYKMKRNYGLKIELSFGVKCPISGLREDCTRCYSLSLCYCSA